MSGIERQRAVIIRQRFLQPSQAAMRQAALGQRPGVARLDRQRPVITGNGIVQALQSGQGNGAIDHGGDHFGLHHQGAIVAVHRHFEALQIAQRHAAIVEALGHIGLNRQRPVERRHGFFRPARGAQRHAVIHQCAQIVGKDLQRLAQIVAGFGAAALLQSQKAQIIARPEQKRIDFENAQVKGFRLRQVPLLMEGDGLFGHGFQIQNFHSILSRLGRLCRRRGGLGHRQGRHVHDTARRHRRHHHMHRL